MNRRGTVLAGAGDVGVALVGEAGFGALLKEYRERARLSQAELAARAGLSRRGISDLERGARRAPQRETTRRLMEALGLSEQQRSRFLDAAREGHFAAQPLAALPLALTSFIGREREIQEIIGELERTRLLTITGIGGIGKTRIALDVARRLEEDYADGIALVDLSSLNQSEASQVPQRMGSALGLREQPATPITQSLIEFLRERQTLVVLDNCEHLLDACAALVDQVLRACAGLRILATSREPLGVPGETRWALPPMHVPTTADASSAELANAEGVQLFYERARSHDLSLKLTHANLTAIVEICQKLDGLPLAIELAASWISLLSPAQIAQRLDGRLPLVARGVRTVQPRQQTVQASLDWSFDLLSEPEAVLFRRLAVFAGGWTLDAAESVCGDAPDGVLGTLGQLVDKSLVQVVDGRYRFLETVRQYADEKLRSSAELQPTAARHAAYFVDLAAQATSELSGAPTPERHVHLELEHDNLRATVRWVMANADVSAAHVLGTALARFSQVGNHLSEGRAWLADILALSDVPTAGRARTLIGAGLLGAYQGDYAFAHASLMEGVGICRALGEDRELAHGLFALGLMAWTSGACATAVRLGEEGLEVSRRAQHRGFEALHMFICAAGAAETGNTPRAQRLAEECRDLATRVHFGRALGLSLGVLGMLRCVAGEYSEADALLEQAIVELHQAGIPVAVAWATSLRARVALARAEHARALELGLEALRLVRAFNLRGRTPFVLEVVGEVLAGSGQFERAVLLASAAEANRLRIGIAAPPVEVQHVERWLGAARARVGDETWERGARLSLEEAVALALAAN